MKRRSVIGPSAGALHIALGLLLFFEGAVNLGLCIADESGLQLIAFHTAQTVGALLFMFPRTVAPGTCILVCAFLAAAVVHALGHTLPFGHLIYAVAVLIVFTQYETLSTSPTGNTDRPDAGASGRMTR